MAEDFDPDKMIERFRERAEAVKRRTLPPVEADERKALIERAQLDYMDFAIVGDATARLEGTKLILEVDLAPSD